MKFTSTLLTLGLALGAVATPAVEGATRVKRQLAVIEGVISSIQAQVTSLDAAIQAYSSGAPTAIQSASDAVVSVTNAGVTTVQGSADLDQNDALSLTAPVQALTTDITNAINDLVAKKAAIVAAGYGETTYNDLVAQNTSAGNLANAITSKVPSTLQPIAAQLAGGITTAIQVGINAFAGTGGSTSSSAASSAPSSSAPSSSAPASSAPASSAPATSSATGSAPVSPTTTATSAASVPVGTGTSTTATGTGAVSATSSPAPFTGAAAPTGLSPAMGVLAAVAAVMAL